jgi:hypothetical protein
VRDLLQLLDSVEQLEALLLLHRRPDRDWTAEEVSEELRTNAQSVATRLDGLRFSGLVGPGHGAGTHRYAPRTRDLLDAVDALAEEYSVRRVSVITFIIAKPSDRIRSFADAFRLRRDPDA